MKYLLWKDYRLSRIVLLAGVCLTIVPYLISHAFPLARSQPRQFRCVPFSRRELVQPMQRTDVDVEQVVSFVEHLYPPR